MPTSLFLVDTSAWLFALKKDFIPAAKNRISDLLNENAVITTGIIKLELIGGTRTKTEFQRLKTRLDALDTISTDKSLWNGACDLAFSLRRKGITIPYTDIMIAAAALITEATVLHADMHFDMIKENSTLKVESLVSLVSG
jgi:predicted nucleic acid-binding protein